MATDPTTASEIRSVDWAVLAAGKPADLGNALAYGVAREESGIVRQYLPADRDAVRRVAFQTGLFGEPIAPLVPDPEFFADLFTAPYTDNRIGPRFVAEVRGEVVGYIVGATSRREAVLAYARTVLGVLERLARSDYMDVRRALPYLVALSGERTPRANWSLYPTHLHLNLARPGRGQGLGAALLTAFLSSLEAKGAPGVQLSTTDHNVAAVRLYEKFGFRTLNRGPTRAFAAVVHEPVERLVMVRDAGQTVAARERGNTPGATRPRD